MLGLAKQYSCQVAVKKGDEDSGCETEINPEHVHSRMNPIQVVEKDWMHQYKLAQLIQQQDKMISNDSFMVEQFGGIQQSDLRTAFTFTREKSSLGCRSPQFMFSNTTVWSPKSFGPQDSTQGNQVDEEEVSSSSSNRSDRFLKTTRQVFNAKLN